MKKFFTSALALSLFIFQANYALAFSDVSASHKNYDAISYLEEKNILQGYTDGTFRPEQSVTRAEFLKIIFGNSGIPLDALDKLPFSDIDYGAWYLPFIQKAFSEGWIEGYSDGTFKPGQTINKAEALKILGKLKNWNLNSVSTDNLFDDVPADAWFASYIAYAQTNNYLEETGSEFLPGDLMTRGSISEIIYRTLIDYPKSSFTPAQAISSNKINYQPASEPIFTPVSPEIIPKNFFTNLTLTENLPNTFYKNETYIVRGSINSDTYKNATLFLYGIEDSSFEKSFIGPAVNSQFEIPMQFTQTGNFELGMIPGETDASKIYKISVLAKTPETNGDLAIPEAANSLDIKFENDKTTVYFEAPSDTFKKLTFTQNNNEVSYFSRQDIDSIDINYADFYKFKEGEVSYKLETATINSANQISNFTSTKTEDFTASEHTYDLFNEDKITITRLISTQKTPATISINGTAKTDLATTGYVTRADGWVDNLELINMGSSGSYFGSSTIESGSNFTLTYTPKTSGRYILEINDIEGRAVLNHPVYIGSMPLIPDYFDLYTRQYFTGTLDLSDAREELLKLINEIRTNGGLDTIVMEKNLNELAQAHSANMKATNFNGHYNNENQTPEDRRLEKGIPNPVGENVVHDTSIRFAHEALMRSPGHREQVIDPKYTKVGLGIIESNGYLLITQEFSY